MAHPLTYQWRLYNTNLPGATAASLSLTNIQPINAGDYTVFIIECFRQHHQRGGETYRMLRHTSTTNPKVCRSTRARTPHSPSPLRVAPLDYQWRFAGADLLNATNSTYTRSNTQPADAGYSVVVSNYAGSVTSSVAVLTVNSTPPGIIAQWNFNSVPADGSTTTGSTSPSIGTGTATPWQHHRHLRHRRHGLDPAGATDNSGWNTATYPAQRPPVIKLAAW